MAVKLIVAMNAAGYIGKDNDLLWKIPEDLRHFKTTTTGNVVVMGRKTFESMGNRILPNRVNVVVTSNDQIDVKGGGGVLMTAPSLEQALSTAQELADMAGDGENLDIFLMGGKRIYEEGLPYVEEVLVTRVFDNDTVGDVQVELDLFSPETGLPTDNWSFAPGTDSAHRPLFTVGGAVVAELHHLIRKDAAKTIPTNTSF